ncbi:unnamed protein product [Coccothraustes coccothraustes]
MPENGSLLIFACAREPGVAAKRSAIEFAHSGRTLDRKEGSSHSFWSYCLASRLRQSNSPVARLRLPLRPLLVGPPGQGGQAGDGLLMAFTLFSLRSITSCHGSGPQVAFPSPPPFSRGRGSGKGGVRAAAGGVELLKAASGLPLDDEKVWELTAGAYEESFQGEDIFLS